MYFQKKMIAYTTCLITHLLLENFNVQQQGRTLQQKANMSILVNYFPYAHLFLSTDSFILTLNGKIIEIQIENTQ